MARDDISMNYLRMGKEHLLYAWFKFFLRNLSSLFFLGRVEIYEDISWKFMILFIFDLAKEMIILMLQVMGSFSWYVGFILEMLKAWVSTS